MSSNQVFPQQAHAGLSCSAEFAACVTEIREWRRVGGKTLFQIALDHTAFLPGNANEDEPLGQLIATSRGGTVLIAPILAVQQDASGERWHSTFKPLQPGTRVIGEVFATRGSASPT